VSLSGLGLYASLKTAMFFADAEQGLATTLAALKAFVA